MSIFEFYELSENGFTTDGLYAQSVMTVSTKLKELHEYVTEILEMDPADIPMDPDGEPEGYVIRTRKIKY